jgi:hypothetical protein
VFWRNARSHSSETTTSHLFYNQQFGATIRLLHLGQSPRYRWHPHHGSAPSLRDSRTQPFYTHPWPAKLRVHHRRPPPPQWQRHLCPIQTGRRPTLPLRTHVQPLAVCAKLSADPFVVPSNPGPTGTAPAHNMAPQLPKPTAHIRNSYASGAGPTTLKWQSSTNPSQPLSLSSFEPSCITTPGWLASPPVPSLYTS